MIKIQIGLEALAALIGGDTEVEMEIRNGIVQEFTRRYLKGIAQDLIQVHGRTLVSEILKDEIGTTTGYSTALAQSFKAKIKEQVALNANQIVREEVNNLRTGLYNFVNAQFKELTNKIELLVQGEVPLAVNSKIKEEVQKRLKEISAAVLEEPEKKKAKK